MRPTLLALLSAAASAGQVSPPSPQYLEALNAATEAVALARRGAPTAPDGYTPVSGDCPSSRPSVRAASGLSTEESSWRDIRIPNTISAMMEFLPRLNITDFDAASYLSANQNNASAIPKIGIAASGGGYRALMNGAGALAAFDNRTTNSTNSGQLGGLLQSALYLSGLSGGSWLVGSLYQNNVTTVESIINGEVGSVWDFTNTIFEGPNKGLQILTSAQYYDTLHDQVEGKNDAGYNTTVTDYWGRALAFQLINADNGGPAFTWSSLANGSYITNGSYPLPLVISDSRRPGEKAIATNTTIFEFSPWEMGSWDPTVFGFVPINYVGSNFSSGTLASDEPCVTGYDSASFVMGTSSSLFNQFALQYSGANLPSIVNSFIEGLLTDFAQSQDDIASWVNPFYMYRPDTNPQATSQQLTLVDGGENGENVPLHPLIQPAREVDVIFAIDSSADTTYNWPNGTSLVATYERFLNSTLQNHTAFPSIPDQNTFINLGLNVRPTFFGCDGTNNTGTGSESSDNVSPLLVYLPNSPYSAMSNVSTFDLSYSNDERNGVITNGYNVATRGNSSDDMWPTCVGCAIIQRSLVRTGTTIPSVCTQCFTDYCWNGTLNSTTPNTFEPMAVLNTTNTTKNAAMGLTPNNGLVLVSGLLALAAFNI